MLAPRYCRICGWQYHSSQIHNHSKGTCTGYHILRDRTSHSHMMFHLLIYGKSIKCNSIPTFQNFRGLETPELFPTLNNLQK